MNEFAERYYAPGDEGQWSMLCDRVSSVMPYKGDRELIYNSLFHRDWLPNSPALLNAGRGRNMMACHMLEVDNSIDGIFAQIANAAEIFKSGGGLGICLDALSPYKTPLQAGGWASGPVSFLQVFNSTAQVVMEGGLRRAAMMATLNARHSDALQFVTCKDSDNELANFNVSMTIDDGPDNVDPDLWRLIVHQAQHNGEPGVVFLDNVNYKNPTLENFGPIRSVNACGELPLYPYGSCALASAVLPRLIKRLGDWDDLKQAVKQMVRFLDHLITINHYPLEAIRRATQRTRSIGIGVMGLADLLERERIPFVSHDARELGSEIVTQMYLAADEESWQRANEHGGYLPGRRRNAMLMAIAPTGHISRLAECSPSIYAPYRIALAMSASDHIKHVKAWRVDNAVSYTACFVEEDGYVDRLYRMAHEEGIKSISAYPDGSRPGQPLCIGDKCG